MKQARYYRHRDGEFSGHCEGCAYMEVIGDDVTAVWQNGRRLPCPNICAMDVRHFVDCGWWVKVEPETGDEEHKNDPTNSGD